MKCSICGETRAGDKIGGGWKEKVGQVFCPDCWSKLYYVRSVTFPVASIVSGPELANPKKPNETEVAKRWNAFRAAMSVCWNQSTQLANWAITEMARRDTVRTPEMEKLPPSPPNKKGKPSFYLYKKFEPKKPLAVDLFSELDSNSVVAILNTVQAKYKASRFNVIWLRDEALPTFKYPYPYPISSKGWKPRWLSETEKAPVVEVSLNKQRFAIRLRGGSGFRRQKESFAKLLSGDAVACEMAIYRSRASQNDNRIGLKTHTDGATVRYNYMVKLVMWLPKSIIKRNEKVLTVATDPESFIIASFGDSSPVWRVNADHVRRWIAEYDRRRHRLSDDLKAELRAGGRDRFADLRARLAKHQNDRLNSFIHETSRHVADYAKRNKCSEVSLNNKCRSYFTGFPWEAFKTHLMQKLNEYNITFSLWSDRPEQTQAGDETEASSEKDSSAEES